MIITAEIAERLKNNLIFRGEDRSDAVGAFNILIRQESEESIQELFTALEALVKSQTIVGLEVSDER